MNSQHKALKNLSRLLTYVLGIQPDEFGLVPDEQGFVTSKSLLKALHQEAGWRHLRMAQLEQLAIIMRPAPIEIKNSLIRANNRDRLPKIIVPETLPKLLYIPVRKRAYRSVVENGLNAGDQKHLILSSDQAMAEKLGARLDNHFIQLTVQVARSQSEGTSYRRFGETLYLADTIAPGTFTGPALPKEKAAPASKSPDIKPTEPKTPGSYFPEIGTTSEDNKALKRERRRRKIALEKERRLARRYKSRRGR